MNKSWNCTRLGKSSFLVRFAEEKFDFESKSVVSLDKQSSAK